MCIFFFLFWLKTVFLVNSLQRGSLLQLDKGQFSCGVELAMMLMEVYYTDSVDASEENVDRIFSILRAFPVQFEQNEQLETAVSSHFALISAAMRWLKHAQSSAIATDSIANLHLSHAEYVTNVLGWMGLGSAMPHYAKAPSLLPLARALSSACEGSGHAHAAAEEDLFLVRGALQCVVSAPTSQSGVDRSRELLREYESLTARPLPDTPLISFLRLFLEALHLKSPSLVQLLLEKYRPSLNRDSSLLEIVKKSADMHAPAVPVMNGGGLFGNLFRSLLVS